MEDGLASIEGVALLQGRMYQFCVELPTRSDFGVIWLHDREAKQQWYVWQSLSQRLQNPSVLIDLNFVHPCRECVVTDYAKFTRNGTLIPDKRVLLAVADWLEESTNVPSELPAPHPVLRNVFGKKYLIMTVIATICGRSWELTYTFPMERLTPELVAPQPRLGTRRNPILIIEDGGSRRWHDTPVEVSDDDDEDGEESSDIDLGSLEEAHVRI
ncbi:hypothetical protein FI667_g46, partial [Globisporangium splendens]